MHKTGARQALPALPGAFIQWAVLPRDASDIRHAALAFPLEAAWPTPFWCTLQASI